jgi:hypothetical protein
MHTRQTFPQFLLVCSFLVSLSAGSSHTSLPRCSYHISISTCSFCISVPPTYSYSPIPPTYLYPTVPSTYLDLLPVLSHLFLLHRLSELFILIYSRHISLLTSSSPHITSTYLLYRQFLFGTLFSDCSIQGDFFCSSPILSGQFLRKCLPSVTYIFLPPVPSSRVYRGHNLPHSNLFSVSM